MIRNFLFHRVSPVRDKLWDPMDVALFDRCIAYISTHYQVILIEDLVKSDELYSTDKYDTIMFDDGYKDNITFAAPILKKYACKASFYVVTECIDKNIPTWTYISDYAFQYTAVSKIDLNFDFLPADLRTGNLTTQKERIIYAGKIEPFLKKIPSEKRDKVLATIISTYTNIKMPEMMMTWEDLLELKNSGHYIGSHTLTHGMLGTMTDENEIRRELTDSAKAIQARLGHFPITISYPVGSFNEVTKRLSKEAGYKIGLAVKQRPYNPDKEDIFEIPRIELYNEPWFKTRLRITNTLENIKSLIKFK
jgi:peptidoglycan/xylan/chitin deacetylase (PgdA/CDA1 family)